MRLSFVAALTSQQFLWGTNTVDSKTTPYLSVIVPAYNEEKRLPETIQLIETFLSQQDYTWELIIMDDGSSDETCSVARKAFQSPHSRLEKNPRNMGKGATIRNGMLNHAQGQFRLFTDADNSTPIEEVAKLLPSLEDNSHQIAIGSRALPESKLEVRQPIHRELMGRTFNLMVQLIVLPGIKDTQCGFKLFTAKAADFVFSRQTRDGFSFDVEVLYLGKLAGYTIAEIPIRWIDSPASRVSPIRDSLAMFLDLLRVRLTTSLSQTGSSPCCCEKQDASKPDEPEKLSTK